MLDCVPVVELHRAEITEQKNIRRDVAHLKRIRRGRLFDGDALRTDAHRQSQALRRRGEIAIYFARQIEAAGHRGNQDRCLQSFAEKRRAQIDLIDVELRQRVVDEAIAVKTRAGCARDALGIEADF